jgi:hypothetical protein
VSAERLLPVSWAVLKMTVRLNFLPSDVDAVSQKNGERVHQDVGLSDVGNR